MLLAASSYGQAFQDGKAVVRNIQGSATYTAPGSTTPEKLKVNMVLKPGSAVTTADASIVGIFFGGERSGWSRHASLPL